MKHYLFMALLVLACNNPSSNDPRKPITDSVIAPPAESAPVVDGLEQIRTTDGRLSMEGYKRAGQRHGVWTSYTKSGRVKSRTAYSDGKQHGECVVFRENGQLYYTGRYEQGKEAGEWKFYGPNGELEKTVLK
jgi:MORN repeat variant